MDGWSDEQTDRKLGARYNKIEIQSCFTDKWHFHTLQQ